MADDILTLDEALDRLKRAQQAPLSPSSPSLTQQPQQPSGPPAAPSILPVLPPGGDPAAAGAPAPAPAPAVAPEATWRTHPTDPNMLAKPTPGHEYELKDGLPQFRTDEKGNYLTDSQGHRIPKMRNREQEAADASAEKGQLGGEGVVERVDQVRDAINRLRNNSSLYRAIGLGARGILIPVPGSNGMTIGGTVADVSAFVGQVLGLRDEAAKKAADDIMQAQADMAFLKGAAVLQEMAKARQGSAQGATGFGNMTEGERELLQNVGTNGMNAGAGLDNFHDQLTRLDTLMSKQAASVKRFHGMKDDPNAKGKNTQETLDAAKKELNKGR